MIFPAYCTIITVMPLLRRDASEYQKIYIRRSLCGNASVLLCGLFGEWKSKRIGGKFYADNCRSC